METLLYYRGEELITRKDLKRLRRLWGNTPYNYIVELPIDNNTGTGIHNVTELLYTIWNDPKLNERETKLKERIAKGLTPSKSSYRHYVEENVLYKIIQDAISLFNKNVDAEDKIESYKLPYKEIFRLYNIPYKGVIAEMDEEEEKIGVIPKPERRVKFTIKSLCQEQCSTYKCYYVKGSLRYGYEKKNLYSIFPYLGKLYDTHDGSIQVYVYDYKKSNNAVQNIINHLTDKGLIDLN